MAKEFRNEPLTDFTNDANRREMAQAIASVAESLGETYPLFLGGERVSLPKTFHSLNPSAPAEVIGTFAKADEAQAERALAIGNEAFESWKRVPAAERAAILVRTAEIIRRRRLEFAAWMCFEAGKNWVEADADVAEAIDFLDFYAQEAVRWEKAGKVTPVPGERNELRYIPLGTGLVIPPWNFPLAITVGMSSAAVAAGNSVILKPASTTPTIAWRYVEAFHEAGLPPGVLNFLPGPGSIAGNFLVGHPKTRFIAFTGSMEVGLHINALAAKHQPGQIWVKRVIAEMGGKDAIVVDRDTDLDVAARGIVASAFGYQGQKCSACSRAIVHEAVYDAIVERVVEGTRKLRMGPAVDHDTDVGPVIDASAARKIMEYVEAGRTEGRILTGGKGPEPDHGYFIEPTVVADVGPEARISREEIFGPVLALTKARDFDHALELANDTIYGLTGAVYSNDEEHLAKAAEVFHVGNLYFNRKCTGALVGGHPFGGFNMSGTDSKAGGFDYLLLFLQGKLISRKI